MFVRFLSLILVMIAIVLGFVSVTLIGCSTTANKAAEATLNEKIKAQPVPETPDQIAARAAETFSSAPGLTEEQRQKVMAIYSHTFAESMNLRKEIGQSKELLFSTVADPNYKSDDIKRLKKRISDLDKKRLAMMFKALDDVQTVVGPGADRKNIYQRLDEFEIYHGRADSY